MSQDLAGEVWMSAAENNGVYLLNLAIAEGAQNRMQFCQSQGLLHVRLRTAAVKWQCRSGKNLDEVGSQLVLASLKKISIQKLSALHKTSLKNRWNLLKSRDYFACGAN